MTERSEGSVALQRHVGRVLHLTLKRRWFEMIASGVKREEYREIKPYWTRRLADLGTEYDAVQFRNGYRADSPTMLLRLDGVFSGLGREEWSAPKKRVYILRLGEMLRPPNTQAEARGAATSPSSAMLGGDAPEGR